MPTAPTHLKSEIRVILLSCHPCLSNGVGMCWDASSCHVTPVSIFGPFRGFTTTYSKNFGLAKPRTKLLVNEDSTITTQPHATLSLRVAASMRGAPTPANTLNTLTKSMSGSLQLAGRSLTATLTEPAQPSPSDRRHSLVLKTFQSRDLVRNVRCKLMQGGKV